MTKIKKRLSENKVFVRASDSGQKGTVALVFPLLKHVSHAFILMQII